MRSENIEPTDFFNDNSLMNKLRLLVSRRWFIHSVALYDDGVNSRPGIYSLCVETLQ